MIDNNEVVDLGYQDKVKFSESVKQNNSDLLTTLESLKENDYLLLVNGVPVCTGSLDKVQKKLAIYYLVITHYVMVKLFR